MESKKDIGKIFRDGLHDLDKSPSKELWLKIEADLNKKKRKKRAFWLFAGVFLCVCLLGGSFLQLNFQNTVPSQPVVNTEIEADGHQVKEKKLENVAVDPTPKTATEESLVVVAPKFSAPSVVSPPLKNSKKKNYASKGSNNLKKSSIFDSYKIDSEKIAKQNTTENHSTNDKSFTPVDSIPTENSLAENKKPEDKKLPKDEDKIEKKIDPPYDEFHVSPYYGINYGGYFGDFDPISDNTITREGPEIQSVYGVLGRFMFDENLGVQMGIGKIHNRYLSTIDKPGTMFINTQNVKTHMLISDLNSAFQNETQVRFRYESTYIEVPIEAYYVVRERNIGVGVSAGLSILMAGKNKIFASAENVEEMEIGYLKTTVKAGFTANAKVYVFYKFTPSLQLELYPSMQYRIMGDTDNSTYSSYFVSLRSGLTYKF